MQNSEKTTYINILIDTLKKKESVLKKLADATDRQTVLLDGEFDFEAFDGIVEEKEKLLEELEKYDEGFVSLYEKVRDELRDNTAAYAEQVKITQELVRKQTELSTGLQAAEERNRSKLTLYLSKGHQKVKEFKASSKTAAAYYRNMSGKHQDGDSYFFNRKK